MIELKLTIPEQTPSTVSFDQERITIGRAPGNVLAVAASVVSSFHGQILFRDGAYIYQDLQSTNGSMVERGSERTVVDGHKMAEFKIQEGDRILLGDIAAPVLIDVLTIETASTPIGEGTILARRAVRDLVDLSSVMQVSRALSAELVPELIGLLHGLTQQGELQAMLERIGSFVFKLIGSAERVLFQMAADTAQPMTIVERRGDGVVTRVDHEIVLPQNLVEMISKERSALLIEDLPRSVPSASVLRTGWRSVIAAPMFHQESVVGAVVVVNEASAGKFSEKELDLVTLLSAQASAALYHARLHERLKAAEARLREENRFLKKAVGQRSNFTDIIGDSPAIKRIFEQMSMVMKTDTTVLITGETGTGKELVAQAIHGNSPRKDRIFAPINCGALTETLLESELFGHVKGSFTGATSDKKGLVTIADRGTLFLDEIGEISPRLQVKLLRVLQEGEVMPVGATRPLKVNVRVVCATNRDLPTEVAEGRFREDLYYRINVFPLTLPPLRERRSDIPMLAEHFVRHYAAKFCKTIKGLTPQATDQLKQYRFPGNVRELENEIERASLFCPDGGTIDAVHLSDRVQGSVPIPTRMGKLKQVMEGLEKQVIVRALEEHHWNRSRTAETLGISRQALQVKLARYGMVNSREA